MIAGIGTDLMEVDRIAESLRVYGEQFERRVFSPEEIAYCRMTPRRSAERYAARFAAKEAFSKAVGIGARSGFRWREVVVAKRMSGAPVLELRGSMAERFGHLKFHLSLTHTDTLAMAVVVVENESTP
jgi:holo-[acyl-carrier protein] synthase